MVHQRLLISIYNNQCHTLKACMLKLLLVYMKKSLKSIRTSLQASCLQHMGRTQIVFKLCVSQVPILLYWYSTVELAQCWILTNITFSQIYVFFTLPQKFWVLTIKIYTESQTKTLRGGGGVHTYEQNKSLARVRSMNHVWQISNCVEKWNGRAPNLPPLNLLVKC
jgi:hypothetical protein